MSDFEHTSGINDNRLRLAENASVPGGNPPAGEVKIWVNSTPQLMVTNSSGDTPIGGASNLEDLGNVALASEQTGDILRRESDGVYRNTDIFTLLLENGFEVTSKPTVNPIHVSDTTVSGGLESPEADGTVINVCNNGSPLVMTTTTSNLWSATIPMQAGGSSITATADAGGKLASPASDPVIVATSTAEHSWEMEDLVNNPLADVGSRNQPMTLVGGVGTTFDTARPGSAGTQSINNASTAQYYESPAILQDNPDRWIMQYWNNPPSTGGATAKTRVYLGDSATSAFATRGMHIITGSSNLTDSFLLTNINYMY